jgi:hypothetical protein
MKDMCGFEEFINDMPSFMQNIIEGEYD